MTVMTLKMPTMLRLCLVGLFATALFSGCLVSRAPLLDEQSGRAKPMAEGLWRSCPYTDGAPDGECTDMKISIDETRRYIMAADDEDPVYARFRRIGRGAYLVQMVGDGEDAYSYFLGRRAGDGFSMALVICEETPDDLRAALIEADALEIEDNGVVCVAKTRRAAVKLARAYRDLSVAPSAQLRFEKIATGDP